MVTRVMVIIIVPTTIPVMALPAAVMINSGPTSIVAVAPMIVVAPRMVVVDPVVATVVVAVTAASVTGTMHEVNIIYIII